MEHSDTDLTADDISVELLGDEADGLSNQEIDEIKRHAQMMARVVIDVFLQAKPNVH